MSEKINKKTITSEKLWKISKVIVDRQKTCISMDPMQIHKLNFDSLQEEWFDYLFDEFNKEE